MLNDFYNELLICANELDVTEVHYSHVEKNIDEHKTYITYYRTLKTTDYEIGVDSSVIQISIFSKSFEIAINTRDSISKYFVGMNKIIGTTQICGSSIESEIESYDYESKMHHAITSIRFLTKNILGENNGTNKN